MITRLSIAITLNKLHVLVSRHIEIFDIPNITGKNSNLNRPE